MRGYSLETISENVHGRLYGEPELVVNRIMTVDEAGHGDLAVVFDSKIAAGIEGSRASAFVVPMKIPDIKRNIIRVSNPRLALIQLLNLFHPRPEREPVIHERAVVSPRAKLSPGVSVGAGALIEADVEIGAGAWIHPNVCLGEGSIIGDQTEIFPNVTIYPGTRIGRRVRIHAGTVIGSDGFGYVNLESGEQGKIPQVGYVEIEDDVEIGANCTIDRATLGATRILSGTKIDNLVQVGHNSEIGKHSILAGQVGLSGSVRIGNHCVLAGQVGVGDHVQIKDGTMVGGQSGVVRDVGPGRWVGYPAIPVIKALRAQHLFVELPALRRLVRDLERRLTELEGREQSHDK